MSWKYIVLPYYTIVSIFKPGASYDFLEFLLKSLITQGCFYTGKLLYLLQDLVTKLFLTFFWYPYDAMEIREIIIISLISMES